ncbi:MAG TPA: putative lipid II flippase FtsW [Candidatus Paceibacterota bacterium]|nr:putative lipid II flippase FtsW [Candidatus Pacearchaeota archaeon]HRZ51260.1 putative lipid II flippase FtsW [Candidatus Paceibacterota bacterium]HSA36982.1 putative lipid II flippase FtsW [Candidatus Paceibacterota bacterium]
MMKVENKVPDYFLLIAVISLLVIGVLILSSASAILSQAKFHNSYYLLVHQITNGIIPGLILGTVAYFMSLEKIRKVAPVCLLGTIVLMALVFVPGIGFSAGGAQRWLNFGTFTVQPSEILKPVFILYLASWLASKTEKSQKKIAKKGFSETLMGFMAVVGLVGVFLIFQPDISTFGIITLTALCMYFLSGTPLKHTALIVFLGAIGLLALVALEPYRFDRLMSWLSPEMDPMGNNFQPNQALITVGSGGIFGQGFGASSQKAAHIPELIGDSVFAPYALEMGFVGCAVLIFLFSFFIWRGFKIAKFTEDKFSRLVVSGITFWIALQSLINIASTSRLIPLSGVPLPFISYGGTALMAELVAVGIMLNISKRPRL